MATQNPVEHEGTYPLPESQLDRFLLRISLGYPGRTAEMAILDETDSGLDIDALRIVAEGVNAMLSPDMGVLLITHYTRILRYITPDRVHVMFGGRIVESGGPELAEELEANGYERLRVPS